ncbi:ABC transporter ATP-binding protein [Actinomarinicola tropica]|uniref:ATP-binding cassette domain-containing protein n=1 Tax=Actinomarinicola tropica TaxID=2789776 RepID=A0A5Q2RAA9_9ACTN|nr:ATP-binding cassette domain-containing protein [Actinomarinicola tropica]QGG93758.1 ATP-binding cassette domain-containing protein [Actinomarinicola tropica]
MLSLRGLRRHYGDVVALDGLSFEAQEGRLLGFLGPNGAGKTTAMRSIFGLVEPDAGEVLWRDAPVDASVRRRFGYMPEQRGLYPKMPCAAQLSYFGQIHGMDRADADGAARRWLDELGLGERADDPVEALSHGNQQRVQLAAALVHDPELLVLDEPFSGLDPLGVASMEEVLREQAAEGRTIIFSSHQLDLVEALCDDVVIIHRGRAVRSGTIEAIRAASEQRRVEVTFEGAVDWTPPSPEVLDLVRRNGAVGALVPSSLDVDVLLASAREAGDVRGFRWEPPSLSELFVEAVGGAVSRSEVTA